MRGLLQFKEASDCFSEASFEIGQECLLICHTDKDSRNVDLESSIVQLEAEFFCYVCTAESGKDPVEQIRITLNTAERSTELAKSESKFIL